MILRKINKYYFNLKRTTNITSNQKEYFFKKKEKVFLKIIYLCSSPQQYGKHAQLPSYKSIFFTLSCIVILQY